MISKTIRKRRLFDEIRADSIIITNFNLDNPNPNMTYYGGYSGIGCYVASKDSEVLMVPKMDAGMAKNIFDGKVKIWRNLQEDINKIIKTEKIKILGTDERTSYVFYNKIKRHAHFKDISVECKKVRQIKDDDEISCIKKACKVTDKIFEETVDNFNFKSETELKDKLMIEIIKEGLEPSFAPIVASGKNSGNAHWNSSGKISKGFCIIDFGVNYKGYCSDMSRTIYLGKPNDKEVKKYHEMKKLQENIIEIAYCGKKCSELARMAADNLGKYMTHSLGHGLGLEIHEFPTINAASDQVLQKGMVFTIEPGYYDKKYGIRIEDSLFMKIDKAKPMTRSTKELIIKSFK